MPKLTLRKIWDDSDVFKKLYLFLFFSRKKRIDFYDSLINYLETGTSLNNCFENLCVDAEVTKQKQLLIFQVVKERIENGKSLNEALRLKSKTNNIFSKFFKSKKQSYIGKKASIDIIPKNELALIETGENSDQLIKTCLNIKNQLEVISSLQSYFISRIGVTFLVALAAFGSIVYQTGAYLEIREYLERDKKVEFPPVIENFFTVGDILTNHTLLISVSMLMIFALIAYSLPNYTGSLRNFMHEKIAPWTVYRNFKAAEFFLAFSTLMNSGMKTTTSLKMLREYANPYVDKYLSQIYLLVKKGKEEKISFDSQFFPIRTKLVLFSILKNDSKSLADGVSVLSEKQTLQARKSVTKFAAVVASILFFTIVAFVVWAMQVSFDIQDVIATNFGD